jgi:hypothetical protein
MNTAEYLARVGYEWLIEARGIPREWLDDDWGDEDLRAATADRDAKEHLRVARELLHIGDVEPRNNGLHGIRWGRTDADGILIDWPDRVPGLKTWAGRQSLHMIVRQRLSELSVGLALPEPPADWFAWLDDPAARPKPKPKKGPKAKGIATGEALAEGEAAQEGIQVASGASGIDALVVVTALDAGFSLSSLGIPVPSRPFTELLAVIGLQSLPLVSFGPRVCGFVHGGNVWRFAVKDRDGWGKVWGPLERVRPDIEPVWSIKAGL